MITAVIGDWSLVTPTFHGDASGLYTGCSWPIYVCVRSCCLHYIIYILTSKSLLLFSLSITSPLLTLHHFSLTHSLTFHSNYIHTFSLSTCHQQPTHTHIYIKRLGHILKKIHLITPLRAMKILEKQIDLQSCRYCTMPEHFPKPRCLHQS